MVAVAAESMVGGTKLVPPEDDSSEFSSGLGPQPNRLRQEKRCSRTAQENYRLTTPSTLSMGTLVSCQSSVVSGQKKTKASHFCEAFEYFD
jgi:hypothetical protein